MTEQDLIPFSCKCIVDNRLFLDGHSLDDLAGIFIEGGLRGWKRDGVLDWRHFCVAGLCKIYSAIRHSYRQCRDQRVTVQYDPQQHEQTDDPWSNVVDRIAIEQLAVGLSDRQSTAVRRALATGVLYGTKGNAMYKAIGKMRENAKDSFAIRS
jgi:hypothetical protein